MTDAVAHTLVAALILFNDKPRFGPRDRHLAIDSYSVAADITKLLQEHGRDWRDPALQPPTN